MSPLRHGLEVVDRLSRLDFDDAVESTPARDVGQDQVWIARSLSRANGDPFIVPDVDTDFKTTTPTRLELSNDSVVLQLFPNGS